MSKSPNACAIRKISSRLATNENIMEELVLDWPQYYFEIASDVCLAAFQVCALSSKNLYLDLRVSESRSIYYIGKKI